MALIAKHNVFQILTWAIKQKMPDEDGKEVRPKWIDRAPTRQEAEDKVEALKKTPENAEVEYLIEEESGRMVERQIIGIVEVIHLQPPKNIRAMPAGVEPPPPQPVGVVLEQPPEDKDSDDEEKRRPRQQLLPAREPNEKHHPRWVEILNEGAKVTAKYEL